MQKNSVPEHVAIILDGNRRWARKRGLRPWEGHFAGTGKNAEEVAQAAMDIGIKYLTVWAGSYDNLTKRSKMEVRMLNKAYCQFIEKILKDEKTHKNEVRVQIIGEWEKLLEPKTINLIKRAHRETKKYNKRYFTALIAYNGDREMTSAVEKLVKSGKKSISNDDIKKNLWTSGLPLVDLVIRTGVERDPHNSTGFMMWHTRYSQLYFTRTTWPDFTKKQFLQAIKHYSKREKRLGK